MNESIYKFFIYLLPFLIVFIASLYKPYDADLGWHLKYGQYFFEHHQVLRDNPYSTQMANFHWPNSSWLTDLISYTVFNKFSFLGLTVLSSAVVTLTFFFFSKAARLSFWEQVLIFPLIVYLEEPVNQVSFRGQLLSLLLLGAMYYVLSLYGKHKKIVLLLVSLFLFWINLHGEFLLGLGLFAFWIGLYLFKQVFINGLSVIREQKFLKEALYLGLVFLASLGITLINPFGVGLYEESFTHIFNPHLKNIIEFLPFDLFSTLWWNHIITGLLLTFGLIYLYFNQELKQRLPSVGPAVLLFLLTLGVRRYGWPAYYFSMPLLQPLALMFEPTNKKTYYLLAAIFLIIFAGYVIKTKIPFSQFKDMSWQNYCRDFVQCSDSSAQFLIRNSYDGNLLTFYNWGGWLIWNYPQIKPSIDGRMHLWRDKTGYSAFDDYYKLEQNLADIEVSKYDVVYMTPEKPLYKRLVQLTHQRAWKQVYQDPFAGIFVRVN